MTNFTNRWIKKKLEELREEFGNECKICESKEKLEFAHLAPTNLEGRGRGRKERYYDIKNNKDSYILLCKSCHQLVDQILRERLR